LKQREITQAITQVLAAENKAKELLAIFGSTQNMQTQLVKHVDIFVEEIVNVTAEVFNPIIKQRGELPDREIMAKLLDSSFNDLIEHNARTGHFPIDSAQPIIDFIKASHKSLPLAVDYFRHSLSCFLLGLNNAGKKYLALSIIEVAHDDVFLGALIDDAQQKEYKSKAASDAGKKGKDKRWEAKEKTRLYSIELFNNKNYKNSNQAAEAITEQVYEYGRTVGFYFTGTFQANKTIYKWLLNEVKLNKVH